ncbi:MAG: folylpolyglutamate synthase/dihydrofolate synthase family protein [Actinomycetes bacterium]
MIPSHDRSDADVEGRLREIEVTLTARAPESDIQPGTDRVAAVLSAMGDPQRSYPSIHVAGTNGKTSTTRMIDALLRAFELRTGLYTSPHLESITERISLDGVPIEAGAFVSTFDEVAPYLQVVESDGGRPLTFFEVLTVMAFAAFADAPVSVASVEVGLGGRWDATNVIDAPVSVVMPIGLDHTDYLGDTVELIAGEKAGIIAPGQLTVLAQQDPTAEAVVLRRAAELGATVAREGLNFGVLDRRIAVGGQFLTLQGISGVFDEVFLPLYGAHQATNAACALAAVEAFFGGGPGQLDAEVVRAGFAEVSSPGRLEIMRRNPTVIVDATHNPEGASTLVASVEEAFEFSRLVGVVGVLNDKNAEGILGALEPLLAEIVVTRSRSPRALDPDDLGELAAGIFGSDRVVVEPRLLNAVERAIELAEADDPQGGGGVLITGSVTLAGEARGMLRR